jgi:CheY-like chemotaxis protein
MSFSAKLWEKFKQLFSADSSRKKEPFSPSKFILCVDDDVDFCAYMQRMAVPLQIALEKAYTMEEAKQKIEEGRSLDAFIIDGHLPDGSGFELVAWIREKQGLEVPIAFLSRIYQDATSFRLLKEQLNVNYVLEKPLSPQDATHLFEELISYTKEGGSEEVPEDLLADLKNQYYKSIYDKVERLQRQILAVQRQPTTENLKTLQTEVHKIAGSSGSYGFLKVSKLCKDLEAQIIDRLNSGAPPSNQWLASLDQFFAQIKLYFQTPDQSILSPAEEDQIVQERVPLENCKILLVDDDPDVCQYIEQALKDVDLNVLSITDAAAMWETLDTFDPQILLLDIHLPGYNIIDIMETLHATPRYQKIAVVMTTVTHDPSIIEKAYRAKVEDILFKPLDKAVLQKRLISLAKRKIKERRE